MIRWAIEARGLCGAASQLHIGFIIFSTHSKTKSKVSTRRWRSSELCVVCVRCVHRQETDHKPRSSQQ